jgi:2,3-bisphosphoglycerate-dependent phosphoglycerate mutase
MAKLVLVRHGQSQWNLENRFTGWVDVPLSPKGIDEAHDAGRRLKGLAFQLAFTSKLQRAQETLKIILGELRQTQVPVVEDPALNERHYGDLQGQNKAEAARKFGAEQVHIWRRSYDVAPPNGESLKDTAARTIPYFDAQILPAVKSGKNVIVAAHGNSLRSIIMDLDRLTQEQVLILELPTGTPVIYDIDATGRILSKTQPDPASNAEAKK